MNSEVRYALVLATRCEVKQFKILLRPGVGLHVALHPVDRIEAAARVVPPTGPQLLNSTDALSQGVGKPWLRIRIRRIHMFLGLRIRTSDWRIRIFLSSSKNSKKNLDSYCFVTSF
jgi:hypothetical protein